ncbi:MAG: CAP domain-containing protein [Gaiella sp.]
MRRTLIASILGFALLAGLLAPVGALAGSPTPRQASSSTASLEAALVREINALRKTKGLRALTPSAALERAAAAHTAAMLAGGFFAHETPDGTPFADRLRRFYADTGPGWTVGENLALYGPDAPTAADIVRMWLGSPLHRANLLRTGWKELGVAVRFATAAPGDFGGEPTWVITLDLGARKR